jgi:hypothetical protein
MSDDAADAAEFIAYHLNEARIFKTYGCTDRAWDECVAVLERFPDNAEAKELLLSLDWRSDAQMRVFLKGITGRDLPWPPDK